MGTRCNTVTLDSARDATCSDCQGQRLVIGTAGGTVSVFDPAAGVQGWTLAASWRTQDAAVAKVAWAGSQYGGKLATAGTGCAVQIWREADNGAGSSTWELQATLHSSDSPITDLAFAPQAHGLWLAAASANGAVRCYRQDTSLPGSDWRLDSEIFIGSTGTVTSSSLAWRPASHGVPPLLLVADSNGATAWLHNTAHGRWTTAVQLPGPPATAVAWAPTLGRPSDLVAVASATSIAVWSLTGPANSLVAEKVADLLEASSPVWQMKFNELGNWLAASQEGGSVQLWRPVLDGTWQLLTSVHGTHLDHS